jgi:hypothetical protein
MSMKVIEFVIEMIAYGWSAGELHFQYSLPLPRADPFGAVLRPVEPRQ